MRIPYISLLAAGALALGGCAYGDFGYGLGFGSGYYGDYGYGYPYYGAGFGYPDYGWYDDFYYPGTGIYVYDSYRRPHVWTDRQRNYWASRRHSTTTVTTTGVRENWSGFNRRHDSDRDRDRRH